MSARFFLDMDSSSLWSDSIVKTVHRCKCRIALLQRQWLASLSLYVCISASVSALLVKAMGLLSCRSTAPRPTWEALNLYGHRQ